MAELTEMDRSLSRIKKKKKINFIAQHVTFLCFKYVVKLDLHVFLIEKLSTLKNHSQM